MHPRFSAPANRPALAEWDAASPASSHARARVGRLTSRPPPPVRSRHTPLSSSIARKDRPQPAQVDYANTRT